MVEMMKTKTETGKPMIYIEHEEMPKLYEQLTSECKTKIDKAGFLDVSPSCFVNKRFAVGVISEAISSLEEVTAMLKTNLEEKRALRKTAGYENTKALFDLYDNRIKTLNKITNEIEATYLPKFKSLIL